MKRKSLPKTVHVIPRITPWERQGLWFIIDL